ncbi:hypothetical protein GGS26DRAFT_384026 [Hypomontagnella submonticulosa]|nr:hypothetical protein GGS26DRAFT_384026 [Hypomontagnella submonticulosa]
MDVNHLAPDVRHPRDSKDSKRRATTSQSPDFVEHLHSWLPMNPTRETRRTPRKLVLCFDGTGNKFRGDDSDSNILKIFRCLDREAGDQFHYYQPGIGTYVVSNSLSHTSLSARVRSWYLKAKDSAVGSSFDHHVVGGYRFLMRFYHPGDEIYFFGFSRGAYVARFLAEMLDYVGLLSHGNEEMVTFAWKAFSQWQSRQSGHTEEHEAKRREMYRFMKGFRETFSRPVKRIRFLGLFDTVNSVPRFETAWMQRSKMPYTARSSAKVIRHCVSIDERRAKFRQDLMYQGAAKGHQSRRHLHEMVHEKYRARRGAVSGSASNNKSERGRRETLAPLNEQAFRPHSRSRSRTTRGSTDRASQIGNDKADTPEDIDEADESDDDDQDIDEVWFAGGHGDVGGGWEIVPDTKSASHVPLTYMVREAQRAGLTFDVEKLAAMGVTEIFEESNAEDRHYSDSAIPDIHIDKSSPKLQTSGGEPKDWGHFTFTSEKDNNTRPFHRMIHKAHLARIHDSLEFASGLGKGQVVSWNIMEYMPFRRMDLQPDGSWKPIRWPLPCGEVRDIPHAARIHGSVIRRMKEDSSYRPGNLIIGGGGRGMRRAPQSYGIGEWVCVQEHGDPIGEVWVRKLPDSVDSS